MGKIQDLKLYIQTREDSYNFSYRTDNQCLTYYKGFGDEGYQFNKGEKAGNFLLIPQAAIIEAWAKTNADEFPSRYRLAAKAALVVASILVLAATLFGLLIKAISERVNSAGDLRSQMRKHCLEIQESEENNLPADQNRHSLKTNLEGLAQKLDSFSAIANANGTLTPPQQEQWNGYLRSLSESIRDNNEVLFIQSIRNLRTVIQSIVPQFFHRSDKGVTERSLNQQILDDLGTIETAKNELGNVSKIYRQYRMYNDLWVNINRQY